jgi:hypothetical protein
VSFARFPHTPHLVWLGRSRPRGDKVLTPSQANELLMHEIVVEEKVDGSNVGFSVDEQGDVRVQNRGSYLSRGNSHPQFKPLFRWLELHRDALVKVLAHDFVLFGEWCYAVHSVHYSSLPDWFLAFDVLDVRESVFCSVARRDEVVRQLDLEVVPKVATGRFDLSQLVSLLGRSRLGEMPAEGLYVRHDQGDRLVARAKIVREEFVQNIVSHWSRGPLRTNALAGPKVGSPGHGRRG